MAQPLVFSEIWVKVWWFWQNRQKRQNWSFSTQNLKNVSKIYRVWIYVNCTFKYAFKYRLGLIYGSTFSFFRNLGQSLMILTKSPNRQNWSFSTQNLKNVFKIYRVWIYVNFTFKYAFKYRLGLIYGSTCSFFRNLGQSLMILTKTSKLVIFNSKSEKCLQNLQGVDICKLHFQICFQI